MKKIRVATFNVFYGNEPQKIAQAIKDNPNLKEVDIMLLQEVEAHADELKERAQSIADELGLFCVYSPARASGKETKLNGTHGLAILSKFPIKEFEAIPLKKFNLRYNSRTRIALNAIIEVEHQLIQVCNVHLDLRINIKERTEQIEGLIKKLNDHQITKIIMGGDFNTVPLYWAARMFPIFYSPQKRKFNAFVSKSGFQTTHGKIGYTMHQRLIKFSLDSIYTKGLNYGAFGVERSLYVSDHKPVWVDIEL
ncbi:MAG: hypothetical protein NVSMB66_4240 [Candidatus Doudnabacteria bacterium]